MNNWQTEYYQPFPGKFPVFDFVESLPQIARAKINNTIELLKEFGLKLGPPHSKKLTGTPLWELRILGQNNIRIFYVAIPGQKFLLLHGFVKKSDKTPTKEINTATKRLLLYHNIVIK